MFYDNSKELERIDELEHTVAELERTLQALADEPCMMKCNPYLEVKQQLYAEREKVKGLEAAKGEYLDMIDSLTQECTDLQSRLPHLTAQIEAAQAAQDELWTRNGYLQADLTQLQQLVGALPKLDHVETVYAYESGVNSYMVGGLQVRFQNKADRDAYVALLRYRATLPAPATHEVTKAQVFNEWGEALHKMADVPKGDA